jgi:hypothetical protein
VWGDFVAAMQVDPGLAPIAPLIRAVIAGDTRDWAREAAMLGIGKDIALAAGFAPLVTDNTGASVEVEEVTLLEDRG